MIREMLSSDVQQVSEMVRCAMFDEEQAHPPLAEYSCEILENFFAERYTPAAVHDRAAAGEIIFVAEQHERIVGTVTVEPATKIIRALFVDPAYQNRGYGTELMNVAEQWCREHGIDEVTIVANLGAVNFYPPRGYEKKCERVHEGDGVPIPEMVLTKKL